jgi:hypothetical protein
MDAAKATKTHEPDHDAAGAQDANETLTTLRSAHARARGIL